MGHSSTKTTLPMLRQLDCSPIMMRTHWCGTEKGNPLLAESMPNKRQRSQSRTFEEEPLIAMQYMYKDIIPHFKKDDIRTKEDDFNNIDKVVIPEFDDFGKVVVQWNWGYNNNNSNNDNVLRKLGGPSHIVLFDSEETEEVKFFLRKRLGCVRERDFFHSFAQGDMHASRLRSRIALWLCTK